jgi:hypothetical protein
MSIAATSDRESKREEEWWGWGSRCCEEESGAGQSRAVPTKGGRASERELKWSSKASLATRRHLCLVNFLIHPSLKDVPPKPH